MAGFNLLFPVEQNDNQMVTIYEKEIVHERLIYAEIGLKRHKLELVQRLVEEDGSTLASGVLIIPEDRAESLVRGDLQHFKGNAYAWHAFAPFK